MRRAPGQIFGPPWRPDSIVGCRASKRRQYCSLAHISCAKWTFPHNERQGFDTDGVIAVRDALRMTLLSMMVIDEAKNEFVFNGNDRLAYTTAPHPMTCWLRVNRTGETL